MPFRSKGTPLRGRYLVRNPAWNAWLRAADVALGLATRSPVPVTTAPRRLLISIGGHLGDAVIASSVLPLLRHALPETEIGVMLGSWARPALEGHPDVRWFHEVDHWKLMRGTQPLASRFARWRRTQSLALREIRQVGYDAAVDLSAYYPNMSVVLRRAEIPIRIGWSSGGYGPLYTHVVDWTLDGSHTAMQHRQLLGLLTTRVGELRDSVPVRYDLPPIAEEAMRSARAVLDEVGVALDRYAVVHMGTGDPRKRWQLEGWRRVSAGLLDLGYLVVLTGTAGEESAEAERLVAAVPGSVSLAGRLPWIQLRALIARARLVVSVDTVVAHLAAAASVPCVVLNAGMSDARHWKPLGPTVTMLMADVPCAPCFRSRGCASMACIRHVKPERVLEAVQPWARRDTDGG